MRDEIIGHIQTWSLDHARQDAASGQHRRWEDERFESLARRLFAWQVEQNLPYQRYAQRLGVTPQTLQRWEDLPAVPTDAFKHLALHGPAPIAHTFQTSGTTQGLRGQHKMASLATYEASILAPFVRHAWPHDRPVRLLALTPSWGELPESSLSFMVERLMAALGSPDSGWFVRAQGSGQLVLELDALSRALDEAQAQAQPVLLLGTAFSYVAFLDQTTRSWQLPSGSRLIETGGFKGRTREVSRAQLYAMFQDRLGLAQADCLSEYSMTELSSQAYSDPSSASDLEARRLRSPPWARVLAVDPVSLRPYDEPGRVGLLRWIDLANTESVLAVQTSDMGLVDQDGGFVLMGRASDSELRGCSLTIEELLRSSGGQHGG